MAARTMPGTTWRLPSRAVLVTVAAGAGLSLLHLAGRAAGGDVAAPLGYVEQGAILLALVLSARTARVGPDDLRPSWRLVAIGLSITVVASVAAATYALVTGHRPQSPTLLDPVYWAAYPFYIGAALRLPRRPQRLGLRDTLDGVAAGSLAALAVGRHVVEPLVAADVPAGAVVANFTNVVLDLTLLWVLLSLLLSSRGFRLPWIAVLAGGMGLLVIGELGYLSLSVEAPVPGQSPVFLLFLWGFLLVSLAAWMAARPHAPAVATEPGRPAASEWEQPGFQLLPLVLLAGDIALVGVEAIRHDPHLYVVLGGLAVALVLGIRQVLTLRENRELLAREREVTYRLRELDRMRSDFVAMVSHDLANPLTAVKGLAMTLRRRWAELDPARREELLEVVEREASRMEELSREVLTSVHSEHGELSYAFERLDLAQLVERCVRVGRQLSPRHGFAFERAGETWVRADRARIQEALLNLIDNAIKYSPGGGRIEVVVRGEEGAVRVSVADEGVGLEPEDLTRVFDRLVRIRTDATQDISGTGLGLYIVRRIVEDHGGRIWADGAPGGGATFTFELPWGSPVT